MRCKLLISLIGGQALPLSSQPYQSLRSWQGTAKRQNMKHFCPTSAKPQDDFWLEWLLLLSRMPRKYSSCMSYMEFSFWVQPWVCINSGIGILTVSPKWASRSTNGRYSTSAAQPPAVVFLAPLMPMINIEWSDISLHASTLTLR